MDTLTARIGMRLETCKWLTILKCSLNERYPELLTDVNGAKCECALSRKGRMT